MIQANPPHALWYPEKKLEGFGSATQLSSRAREIAKSREELLGLLHDLPESEYELSFTDLVEKSAQLVVVDDALSKNRTSGDLPVGDQRETKRSTAREVKERKKLRRNSSSGNGVLLNMYMPCSLTRSLTTSSRSGRETMRNPKVAVDCPNKREKEPVMFGCLSGLWERRREKSKRKVEERERRGI